MDEDFCLPSIVFFMRSFLFFIPSIRFDTQLIQPALRFRSAAAVLIGVNDFLIITLCFFRLSCLMAASPLLSQGWAAPHKIQGIEIFLINRKNLFQKIFCFTVFT